MKPKSLWKMNLMIAAAIVLLAAGGVYLAYRMAPPAVDEGDRVKDVVLAFGKKLDMVSLLAPRADAAKAIETNYAPFVSPELLDAWKQNPERAPGRTTSNPHPDRIEILGMQRDPDGAYVVQARVVEVVTGSTAPAGGYQIALKLRERGGHWVITGLTKAILNPAAQ